MTQVPPALCPVHQGPGEAGRLLIIPQGLVQSFLSFQSLPSHSGLPALHRVGACPPIGLPTSREMPSADRARGQHLPQLPLMDSV